ncbi:MAG: tetratricopeptide repeat protein [Burkholderiaceae bacterium]|jgi:TPR repeat protein|nr:tetratricopeptide repeat protein [Burkholderiaceae bacterium]
MRGAPSIDRLHQVAPTAPRRSARDPVPTDKSRHAMKPLYLAIALCAATLSTSQAQVPMQDWQGLAITAITSAEKGTVRDMVRAGHYYRTGFGVHRDWTQALRWYKQAARAGDANAAYWAGKLYLQEQRPVEAREWFARAVGMSLEEVQASWELGQLYLHGTGVEQDKHRAAAHFFNAAAFGHAPAQYELAQLLLEQGDERSAAHWLRQAAEQGHPAAAAQLQACALPGSEGVDSKRAECVTAQHG